MTTLCPKCEKPGGALTADPHCKSQTCDWNNCHCGVTYSRTTGDGFGTEDKKNVSYPSRNPK